MLTLWAMARSPLILGANLTLLDDATFKLLSSPDVIRVDQTATASSEVLHSGDIIAWSATLPADSPNGSAAIALFNTGETQAVIDSTFEAYNVEDGTYKVTDAWTGKSLGKLKSIQQLTLEPHASILWLLKK
jgi:hypothetical protein